MNKVKQMLLQSAIITMTFCGFNADAGQAEIDQIERAASLLDIEKLTNLSQQYTGYDAALAHYRLALSANLSGRAQLAKSAIKQAMSQLEQLNTHGQDNVEVKALLAQVYGYTIALSPIKGIVYGSKAQNMLKQAKQLAADNPRVLLVQGIAAINTPPMFGGDKEEALSLLNQAIAAYADDIYSSYHWGYAEAYTLRGMIYQQQGQRSQALADWQQALKLDPNYGWAKSLIAQQS